MKKVSIPKNEQDRLEALRKYEILDTKVEKSFDQITKIASSICDTPISLICLVDSDRQWFKSYLGLDVRETGRDFSYCAHAILSDEIFIVEDASKDKRFSDSPFLISEPYAKFYAGVPLIDEEGFRLGTLCVIDTQARKLTSIQLETLESLATNTVALLTLRRKNIELSRMKKQFEEVERISKAGGWELDLVTSEVTWTDEVYKIYGLDFDTTPSKVDSLSYYVGESRSKLENFLDRCFKFGESFDDIFLFNDESGNRKWVRSAGRAEKNNNGEIVKAIGTFQDITTYKNNENKLLELNNYLDVSLDSANLGLWEWDLKLDTIKYDKRWAKILGLEYQDFKEPISVWSSRIHPEDLEKTNRKIKNYLDGLTDKYRSVHRMRHESGEWIYILDQGVTTEYDLDGKPLKFIGTHTDITQIKKKERIDISIENIRERYITFNDDHESFYQYFSETFMDLSNGEVGVLVRYEYETDDFEEIYHCGNSKFQSDDKNIENIYHSIVNSSDHYVSDYSSSENLFLGKYQYIGIPVNRSSKDVLFILIAGNKTQYNLKFFEYLYPLIQVISEIIAYIKLEEDKNEKEYERNIILESTGVALWAYYPFEKRLEWDSSMYNLWEISPGQFRDNGEAWQSLVHPDDIEKATEEFIDTIKFYDKYDTSFRIVTSSGKTKHVKVKADVIRNSNGKAIKILGVNWDSTKDINIKNELIIAKEAAESSARAKSQFLANMSHEIRTPMNGILGMISLLSDTPLDSAQIEMIDTIQSSGDLLMTILNDILDISKIDAGKLVIEDRSFLLKDCIEQTIYLFSSIASEKNVSLISEVSDDVPDYLIGDITRVRQIVVNFLSNATKFTERGSIHLRVFGKNLSKDTFELSISVSDTGVGIKEESQAKLFDSFSQADSSTTRKYGGSGLGLSICGRLASLMGGSISFESKYKEGSTFTFKTKLKIGKMNENTIIDRKIHTNKFENLSNEYPHSILLVEDNIVNQKIASMHLKKIGYDCIISENGQEAIDLITEKGPGFFSLVLMDMQMPIKDGITATVELLEKYGTSTPPIVAMTANVLKEDRDACKQAGMVDYLSKPLKMDELKRVLIKKFK